MVLGRSIVWMRVVVTILVAAMASASLWTRCECDKPAPARGQAAPSALDSCCARGSRLSHTKPTDTPVDPAPADHRDHGCQCNLACCIGLRPALVPGGTLVWRDDASTGMPAAPMPVLGAASSGFTNNPLRPPRA